MFSCPWFLLRLGCRPCRTVTGSLLLLHDTVLDPELETESPGYLKEKAPPLHFEHFIVTLDIRSSISFWQLFSFTPQFRIAVWSYNKTSGHSIFCTFTYLHVWNVTSVSHFILHIHTTRYTSKGKEAGCCQAHQMQTAPIISNDGKLLLSHCAESNCPWKPFARSLPYLCSNWSFGNQGLQLLETKLRSGDRYWQAKSSNSFLKGLIKFCWISTAALIRRSLKMNPIERLFSSHPSPLLPCHKVKLQAVSLRDTTLFHGALACILSRQSVQNERSRLSLFQQKSVKSFSNRSANFSSPVALDRHVFVSMVL